MRSKIERLRRRARVLAVAVSAGVVFQAGGCSVQVTDALFDLSASVLGQLITSYVNDQLNVTPFAF